MSSIVFERANGKCNESSNLTISNIFPLFVLILIAQDKNFVFCQLLLNIHFKVKQY